MAALDRAELCTRLDTLIWSCQLSMAAVKQRILDAPMDDSLRCEIGTRLDHMFNLHELLSEMAASHETVLQAIVPKLIELSDQRAFTPAVHESILNCFDSMGDLYSSQFIAQASKE